MHPQITLTYPCGHAYTWRFDDLTEAEAEKEKSCCPVCAGPCLDLEDQEHLEEV